MGNSSNYGASLVEVMVALFVLAIGLLGMLGMQARALQFNASAYSYSQAVFLANDMAERIRGNPAAANAYVVDAAEADPAAPACDLAAADCSSAELAGYDIARWKQAIARQLPLGAGSIESVAVGARSFLRISVTFDDSRASEAQRQAAPADRLAERLSYVLVVEV